MAERSIFDELAAELSAEERRDLLERIAARVPVSEEPLFKPSERPAKAEALDYAARASSLGLIARLLLALRSMFSGKSRESLLREDDLGQIARRVEARFPLLYDRKRDVLLPEFADSLRRLRDSARFFYDLLDRSVEKDRAAFFAFLASIELPELHRRLVEETDPFKAASGDAKEDALRGAMLEAFDAAMLDLDEAGRRKMYRDLRSLLFLKRLSGFLFERLLGSFRPGLGPGGSDAASLAEARELLLDLGDILRSMSEPPSTSLVEALFVFVEREQLAKPDAESILSADLERAEIALARIRAFNAKVPVVELSRLASGDPGYQSRDLAGGEDWLAIFKGFWKARIDRQVEEWKTERRYRQLAEEIVAFVGEPGPAPFSHIARETSELAPGIWLEGALSFLDGFFRSVFAREMARPLKLILVDGEFYRKDNRLEFTDAFDGLSRVGAAIASLDARLGPEGDLGSAWARAKTEVVPGPVRDRKLQAISRDADDEAERVVRAAAESLAEMTRLLGGLVKGEAGGRYDSLSNLSYLDGKANKEFLRSLAAAKDRCERALTFLDELSGLDIGGRA